MPSAAERLIRRVVAESAVRIGAFIRARRKTMEHPHPFLSGLHAPVREEVTLTDLAVTGAIPPELDGTYLRIGPNPVEADPATYHWFLGDGMVHGVRLKGGRALWYRNRWVRSRRVGAALGMPPAPGPRNGEFDTVNTNVIGRLTKAVRMPAALAPTQSNSWLATNSTSSMATPASSAASR